MSLASVVQGKNINTAVELYRKIINETKIASVRIPKGINFFLNLSI